MKTKTFSININAPKEKVWRTLWDDDTYRLWTSVFSEGSYAQSDWKEGSEVQFLNASKDGMFSRIHTMKPNEAMVFEHLGEIKNGEKQPANEKTKSWSGMKEGYHLSSEGNNTSLRIDVELIDEFDAYFSEMFPKALQRVKELSEQ